MKTISPYLLLKLLVFAAYFCSCSSSRYFIEDKFSENNDTFHSQSGCYHELLKITISNLNNIDNNSFLRALSDIAVVQLFDTLDAITLSKFNQHIATKFKVGEKRNVALYLNNLLSFKMSQAADYFSKVPYKNILKSPSYRSVPVYLFRAGKPHEALKVYSDMSFSQGLDMLSLFSKRAIDIYQSINSTVNYSVIDSISAISPITTNEMQVLLPNIMASNNYNIMMKIFSRPKIYHTTEKMAITILNKLRSELEFDYYLAKKADYSDSAIIGSLKNINRDFKYDLAIKEGYSVQEIADYISNQSLNLDSLLSLRLSSSMFIPDSSLNYFGNLACNKSLKKTAVCISKLISPTSSLSADLLIKLGWLLVSDSSNTTSNYWQIALTKLDTSSFLFKSTLAYYYWLREDISQAKTALNSVIIQFPHETTPRNVYLKLLLNDYDLKPLLDLLENTKANIDSTSFRIFFQEYYLKVREAKLKSLFVWSNANSQKYWVYRDSNNTQWLYDCNFEPLSSILYINSNNRFMIWSAYNGIEYLYNDSLIYQNLYRYLNDKGTFVYASNKEGKTYYYNDSLKWTGIYSYRNKDNKKIYVILTENHESFYDSLFNPLNIYGYWLKSGEKRYTVVNSIKTEYYDSTWKYLNKTKFSVEGYRDIYVSFIDDRLYFYYYNDSNKIVDVDIRLIKSNSNEVIFEENLGDMFKYYFDRYGNYLGYHVMELGDNHQAIILNGNGQCKSYFSYNSTIDDKCFGDNPKNLLSRYPFLSNVLVDLAEPLIFKKAITPLEIFNDISLQIAERQREEVAAQARTETWLAVANALHSFSQSMKRTYSSYNSTNNTPTYTYNNNSYLSSYSSSSRKQNAYSTTVNSYVPSLSNFNKYSFENSPYNYENSPYNYNNSSYNYKNTKYNYKNSEYNYANSIYNYKNSENNYKNNSYNYENSPYNYKNSYFNPNRTSIVNDDGNSVGYAVPKAGGGYNLFDNNGKRIGFSTGEGRGVFNSKGENSGYLVPKKNGGANIFFNEDKSKH